MRWLALLVMALALVAAGCGGGDDEASATDETTVEETTTDTSTAEETTTEESGTDTDLSGVLGDDDCLALVGIGASIAQAFTGAVDSGSQDDLDELASKVPEEIRADVETLAQALAAYSAKLEDIGVDLSATPSAEQLQQLQAAAADLNQEELTAASQRLEAWSKENCTG